MLYIAVHGGINVVAAPYKLVYGNSHQRSSALCNGVCIVAAVLLILVVQYGRTFSCGLFFFIVGYIAVIPHKPEYIVASVY